MRSYSMMVALPIHRPYAHPSITHSITSPRAVRWVESRLVDVPSRPLTPRGRAFPHTPTRFTTTFTMHGLTMTSAVVGTKMTTRATSSSSRVSRGALTIVNSGAGPKRVRRASERTRATRAERANECARAGSRGGGPRRAIARERRRARGTTKRNDGCGEIKIIVSRSSGSRRGCARDDVDGGWGRRIDRAIATAPRIRARGGEG